MTKDEIIDALEKNEEFLASDRIPLRDRLHPDDDLCGLLKLYLLMKPGRQKTGVIGGAQHDVVLLCWIEDLREDVTEEDIVYLRRCGFHYDADSDSLATFA